MQSYFDLLISFRHQVNDRTASKAQQNWTTASPTAPTTQTIAILQRSIRFTTATSNIKSKVNKLIKLHFVILFPTLFSFRRRIFDRAIVNDDIVYHAAINKSSRVEIHFVKIKHSR